MEDRKILIVGGVGGREGNGGSVEDFTGDGDARLETRESLAAARTERREPQWSVSAGGKSRASSTRLWRPRIAAGPQCSRNPVPGMRTSAARWNRCWPITVKPGASSRRLRLLTGVRPHCDHVALDLYIQVLTWPKAQSAT